MPSNRLTHISVATLSALAMTAPFAVAAEPETSGQLASFGAHDASQISADDATAVLVSGTGRSDASQMSADAPIAVRVSGSDRSDAAQISADTPTAAVVPVLDRSDAAQRTPGEITPAVALVSNQTPSVSVDDGFDWGSAVIGAGTVLVLTVLGLVALAVSRRHHEPLAS